MHHSQVPTLLPFKSGRHWMALNYIVSAKKASVVTDAVVGNFTGDEDMNLILAKVNRLEIVKVASDGLKVVQENRDSLLILTAKNHLAIVAWDVEKNELITRAAGSVCDRVGRPSDYGPIACVNKSGLIALRIYDGTLKIIQWEDNKDLKSFNVRFEDLAIVDLSFIETQGDSIRLAYISQDSNGRHLKTVELSLAEKELKTISKQDNIETEARMVIPVPLPCGGVIVIGQETILYNGEDNVYLTISPNTMNKALFTCYASVDTNGQRFLLADDHGVLYMLVLDVDVKGPSPCVKDLKIESLGETTIAECLVYLDNGVLFVGSRFGDSQLVRLTSQPHAENNSFVQILQTFTNLAPIRDIAVMECDGQNQIITCSGAFKEGSLRIIRNGIGIDEAASVDIPGVKGIFTLKIGSKLDNYIIISLSSETHILAMNGEELEDTQLLDLETDEHTLWAGMLGSSQIVLQLVVACGTRVYYLQCGDMTITEVANVTLQDEVACIDIGTIEESTESTLIAVGFWKHHRIALYSLPNIAEITCENMPGDMLPRSIMMTKLENTIYLMVALGDGTLYYYHVDRENGALLEMKKATVGTQPPSLNRFYSRGQMHIFVCSDRPAVIFSSNGKLVFSNVNLRIVTHVCALNSSSYRYHFERLFACHFGRRIGRRRAGFRNSLVMSDGETIVIGTVDEIQKLHIRTVSLGESVRRVVHQPETSTMAILVSRPLDSDRYSVSKMATAKSSSKTSAGQRPSVSVDSTDGDVHSIVTLDDNTFEYLHCHELGPCEQALSVISTKLGDDPTTYYIVGTALVYSDETESKNGRLLVFESGKGSERTHLRLVHEKEIRGAPFSMDVLNGKLIVAINSSVRLFEWTSEKELRLECSHFNYITALFIKVKGDQVLVGDLMRSMTILNYKAVESTFEEVAKDFRGMWMSAVEFIDAETALGAEAGHNLFTCEIDRGADNADEKRRLAEAGMFYLGEMVNVFRRGSLVSSHVDNPLPIEKPILFGTIDGTIGLIVQLPEKYFKFFSEVEKGVARETDNCMRIDHAVYRQFTSEKIVDKAVGFVDGDLVESLLDMPHETAAAALAGIQRPDCADEISSSPEELMKIIEDMSRIH
ncbi:CPSF A subunit region [Ancylostoma ceylanicum]|uniref:DNA damage-binding protein 1 n=1 Tax=Ancylostoma ceylanicum TaxID=53326 RepID=A0A0D6L8Q1_9BILA|nr:CPSF A subunit region [Ancylostoma ceylanicum]